MKRREFHSEISNLSLDELKSRARTLSEELMKLRFRQASGRAEKSHLLHELRGNVARVRAMIERKSREAR